MARALRRALAAAGIVVVAMTGSAPASLAAVTSSSGVATVASVRPINGQTVGVAHPIVVTFTGPVADREAAERSIVVTSPAPRTRSTPRTAWTSGQGLHGQAPGTR